MKPRELDRPPGCEERIALSGAARRDSAAVAAERTGVPAPAGERSGMGVGEEVSAAGRGGR